MSILIPNGEVDPVSDLLKNEACVLQDEVVTGEKRECRCSTLQTDLKFSNYLPSLGSSAGIAFKFEGESCRRCLPKPEDFGPAM